MTKPRRHDFINPVPGIDSAEIVTSQAMVARGSQTITVTRLANGQCHIALSDESMELALGFLLTVEEFAQLRPVLGGRELSAAEATVRFRAGHRGDAARVKDSIAVRGNCPHDPLPPSADDRLVLIEGRLWWNFERFCNLHGYVQTPISETEITHVHRPGTPLPEVAATEHTDCFEEGGA